MTRNLIIWQDNRTGEIYQGTRPLNDLPPLARAMLSFFIAKAYVYLSKSDIIASVWPEDVHREGVTDAALQQLVRCLRCKLKHGISPDCQYIKTWRGIPEGGYRFLPLGVIDPVDEATVASVPEDPRSPLNGYLKTPAALAKQANEAQNQKIIILWLVQQANEMAQALSNVYVD